MNAEKEQQLVAALARLPRVKLASVLPTPLEEMPRLSAAVGGPPIYIKRDDLTGLGYGGNKTRMLEFSLADALRHDADVIVTGAGVQSNYCRQMAAACARLGLELHLLLRPIREVDKVQVQGNHLLQRLFGAKCTILPGGGAEPQAKAILARMEELRQQGRRPYWPRQAETVDIDALAYAESALEIVQQSRAQGINPSHIYLSALDTTQSGVVLGLQYVESPIHVRGFSPFEKWPQRFENMARIANQGAARLGLDIQFKAGDFDNDDGQVGERYGIPTPQGLEALRLVARTEGILLDPVYTSKAMAGLIADIKAGKLAKDKPVVFLHTGGSPAIFGYAPEVLGN
ncbi:MAG: D-cysteine desulfhydrase family protein [Candidatus Latescibacteria bacterium]|nr:D-cysteine desulfhydrase family protein [Candidatus Latescibacterota bacterium]